MWSESKVTHEVRVAPQNIWAQLIWIGDNRSCVYAPRLEPLTPPTSLSFTCFHIPRPHSTFITYMLIRPSFVFISHILFSHSFCCPCFLLKEQSQALRTHTSIPSYHDTFVFKKEWIKQAWYCLYLFLGCRHEDSHLLPVNHRTEHCNLPESAVPRDQLSVPLLFFEKKSPLKVHKVITDRPEPN